MPDVRELATLQKNPNETEKKKFNTFLAKFLTHSSAAQKNNIWEKYYIKTAHILTLALSTSQLIFLTKVSTTDS